MTKREHEIEYLFTVRGLELFILNMQSKIDTVSRSNFGRGLPSQPNLIGNSNAGQRPIEPFPPKKHSFSFNTGVLEPLGIVGIFILIAASLLWVKTIVDPFLLDWRNPILLILAALAICLCAYLVVTDETLLTIFPGIVAVLGVLALFGIRTPFLISVPACYAIVVIFASRDIAKRSSQDQKSYSDAMAYYKKALVKWETETAAFNKKQTDYQRELAQYEADRERWNTDVNAWHADKEHQISECQRAIDEATVKLNALYAAEKIIPLPYRYAEAICYLYDFLSTSSDEYDIRFALERADQAEIKRLMGTIIQNQSQQILLATIQTMELERLHNDNIGIQSAIYESGERVSASIGDMGSSVSASISAMEKAMSDGLQTVGSTIQDGNQRDAELLRDIAGSSSATAEAAAYMAAKQNTGILPAQWEAQEFLIHSRKYL